MLVDSDSRWSMTGGDQQYTLKPLPPHTLPELRQVGKPLRRVDAMGKAVGATVYAGDYSLPLMLHAKVFRSTQACAASRGWM